MHDVVRAFEDASLPQDLFRHRDHLLVAFTYLRAHPFAEAAPRFAANLRRYAEAHGAAGKYHETVTWAYMAIVQERMRAAPELGFEELLAANPDLLDAKAGALADYYDTETLASPLAREVFVLPRRRR
jgi:hypothetical protein